MTTVLDIGTRRELFVDEFLIDRMEQVRLQLYPPVRREVVLEMNATAECPTSAYYNLFEEEGRIRLYYRGNAPQDDSPEQTVHCAESTDGIHFTRLPVNRIALRGSKETSIVYQGGAGHNFHVFRDGNPDCKADERYKAVGGEWAKLYGFVSPDGLQWRKLQEQPLEISGNFDSLNVAFWDARLGCYRLFSRCGHHNVRAIQSCTSQDFLHWTIPVPHEYRLDAEPEEYYTNATVLCPGAEHVLLSFPKRFLPARTQSIEDADYHYRSDGVSDTVFMSSRDGLHWRRFREAWVRPGLERENWTHRSNMVACGIAHTSPLEWSMYISEHYGWTTNRLRRLAVRPWGFAGIHADFAGGVFTTHPLTFTGAMLRVNAATSAIGSIQVELQDAQGKPIPGYTLGEMPPWFGDDVDAVMRWTNGPDVSRLAGQPVRLHFVMRDADLFALRFSE